MSNTAVAFISYTTQIIHDVIVSRHRLFSTSLKSRYNSPLCNISLLLALSSLALVRIGPHRAIFFRSLSCSQP